MADGERSGNGTLEKCSICAFCLTEKSKYTCPRCGVQYCSQVCYKSEKHGQCSEAFYKDCFMEGLKNYTASDDEKKSMMDMLARLENMDELEDVESDEGDLDLEERLSGIDLDGDPDKIWERLTEQERKEFSEMMSDGRLANLIEIWEPWWVSKDSLIQEIEPKMNAKKRNAKSERVVREKPLNVVTMGDHGVLRPVPREQSSTSQDDIVTVKREEATPSVILGNDPPSQSVKDRCPAVAKNIPDLSKVLPKSKPSPDVCYNLVNVLYGYAYTVRLHNGDHMHMVRQCAQELMLLSDVIGSSKNYSSTEQAIHGCLHCLREKAKALYESDEFSLSILEDVQKIISGPSQRSSMFYVMAALSDMRSLYHQAVKVVSSDITKSDTKAGDIAKLKSEKQSYFHVEKRMDFLLSWTQSLGSSLHRLLPEIAFEHGSLFIELADHQDTKIAVETYGVMKKKALIEEVSS